MHCENRDYSTFKIKTVFQAKQKNACLTWMPACHWIESETNFISISFFGHNFHSMLEVTWLNFAQNKNFSSIIKILKNLWFIIGGPLIPDWDESDRKMTC